MSINDGGPVYPCDIRSTTTGSVVDQHWGMSLRDYFAARCPDSQIRRPTWGDIKRFKGLPNNSDMQIWDDAWSLEYHCTQRYLYADAMIAARTTPTGAAQ